MQVSQSQCQVMLFCTCFITWTHIFLLHFLVSALHDKYGGMEIIYSFLTRWERCKEHPTSLLKGALTKYTAPRSGVVGVFRGLCAMPSTEVSERGRLLKVPVHVVQIAAQPVTRGTKSFMPVFTTESATSWKKVRSRVHLSRCVWVTILTDKINTCSP